MSRNSQLEKSDKLIVIVSTLCAAILFSWLTYDIAYLNPLLQGQIEIGKIAESKNKVKRKFNKSLIWYQAGENETVYENDWIFTGAQSVAKIKLNTGDEIIIEPDSLIILSRKNGVLQLDLQHGRLMANVQSKDLKINVSRGSSVESIKDVKGMISVSGDEDLEALIADLDQDGVDELTLDDVAERRLYDPREGYTPLDSNTLSYKEFEEKNIRLLEGKSTLINLSWEDPFKTWSQYQVQIAADGDFNTIVADETVLETFYQYETAESGKYYWRVKGLNENGEGSDWSQSLVSNLEIDHFSKGDGVQLAQEDLTYQLDRPDLAKVRPDRSYSLEENSPVEISWNDDPNAAAYRVQISDKANFSNILEEKITEDTKLNLETLKLGFNYFRVIPEDKDGEAVSEESTGKITTLFPSPQKGKTLDKFESQLLTWDPVPYARTYEVSYIDDEASGVIHKKYVDTNQLKVESNTGYLQWKVRVVDTQSKEELSAFSEKVDWYDAAKRALSSVGDRSGIISTHKSVPIITSPASRTTFVSVNLSPLFMVMSWQYDKEARSYEIEISRNADMANPIYSQSVQNKKRLVINQKFMPGVYYMRVRATHDQVTQEAWSEPEVFRVINQQIK